jgi:hypothetical protein
MTEHQKTGRAATLLRRLLATGQPDVLSIASRLGTDARSIADYAIGKRPMPLQEQRALAAYLARIPAMEREARQLIAQIDAAAAYEQRQEKDAPPQPYRWKGYR